MSTSLYLSFSPYTHTHTHIKGLHNFSGTLSSGELTENVSEYKKTLYDADPETIMRGRGGFY